MLCVEETKCPEAEGGRGPERLGRSLRPRAEGPGAWGLGPGQEAAGPAARALPRRRSEHRVPGSGWWAERDGGRALRPEAAVAAPGKCACSPRSAGSGALVGGSSSRELPSPGKTRVSV